LNVSIQLIDRAARSKALRWVDPSTIARSLVGKQRNLAYIVVWTMAFLTMSAVQGVGDEHPGQFVPFWQQACMADRPRACAYLAGLYSNFCLQGSGWACKELDKETTSPTSEDFPIILRGSKAPIKDLTAVALYARACKQGWPGTCHPGALSTTRNR
jgi:hypothetical protein